MTTRWFLGANTGAGFYSLYDSFAEGEGDYLRVIKGGPGTGKSGFMRAIGAAAERGGLDVEYILCSGDPHSIDAVYLPALRLAYADGTAPHTLDPAIFGVTGEYLDLGVYCDTEGTRGSAGEILGLTAEYRRRYSRAYDLLRAAAASAPERRQGLVTDSERAAAAARARSLAARVLPRAKKGAPQGRLSRRFISAISCEGEVFLEDTLTALCGRVALLDNALGLAGPYLNAMLSEALSRGVDCLLCPDPLTPSLPEAVLLPELSLGFISARKGRQPSLEPWRHVRLDAIADAARIRPLRPSLRADAKTQSALISSAISSLREAKALHDELEALYNPHVDFPAVRAAAGREIARLPG